MAARAWTATTEGGHLRGRRKTNTAPELALRRALHARGARFRLHRQLARGCTPDIVLPGRRTAVFVDGDFWHGCPVHGRRDPFTGPNAVLWREKLERNKQRDARSTRLAVEAGWTVVRVWECSIRADVGSCVDAVFRGESPEPVQGSRD